MNEILKYAAFMLIRHYTQQALDKGQVKRIRNLIVDLASQAIDTGIKHERAATLIKGFATNLTDGTIDWVIKTILWTARATGQITPGMEPHLDPQANIAKYL
jgi:hypothetical protein